MKKKEQNLLLLNAIEVNSRCAGLPRNKVILRFRYGNQIINLNLKINIYLRFYI